MFAKHIHVKRKGHKEFCAQLEELRKIAVKFKSASPEEVDLKEFTKKL